jgi:hypothetical protein
MVQLNGPWCKLALRHREVLAMDRLMDDLSSSNGFDAYTFS